MENETVIEKLSCMLTETEMSALAVELGTLQQQLEGLKSTRKVLVMAIAEKSKIATDGSEIYRSFRDGGAIYQRYLLRK